MVDRRKKLSVDIKETIISLFYFGIRQAEISRRLGIPRTTITGILNRYRHRGNLGNRARSGAPSKLSEWDTGILLRVVKQNRKR
jgi:transposase